MFWGINYIKNQDLQKIYFNKKVLVINDIKQNFEDRNKFGDLLSQYADS